MCQVKQCASRTEQQKKGANTKTKFERLFGLDVHHVMAFITSCKSKTPPVLGSQSEPGGIPA